MRLCKTCGGEYPRGMFKWHATVWHWWCKKDTCSRRHIHAQQGA